MGSSASADPAVDDPIGTAELPALIVKWDLSF
jgi:hypothetical protein